MINSSQPCAAHLTYVIQATIGDDSQRVV
jgi:hypothetical protein